MKHLLTLLLLITSLPPASLFAQEETLMLKPGSEGEDTWLHECGFCKDRNHATNKEFLLENWTVNGTPLHVQTAIRFDLSQVPEDAIITRAYLSLFYAPNSTQGHQKGHEGRNTDFSIRRFIGPWEEHTLTFNNAPATTRQGEVLVNGHRSNNEDFTDLKVTELVQAMHAGENYGFYLSLTGRSRYNILIFASSDHPNADLHPELKVTYTIPPKSGQSIGPRFLTSSPAQSHHVIDLNGIPTGDLRYNVTNLNGNRFIPPTLLPGRGKTELTLNSLPRGTYLITLTLNGRHYATNKFVVKKRVVLP